MLLKPSIILPLLALLFIFGTSIHGMDQKIDFFSPHNKIRTYKPHRARGNWNHDYPFFDAVPDELILSMCSFISQRVREETVPQWQIKTWINNQKNRPDPPRTLREMRSPNFRELLAIESFRLVCKTWTRACSPLFERFLAPVIPRLVMRDFANIGDYVLRGPRSGVATQGFLSLFLKEGAANTFSDHALRLTCKKYPKAVYCNIKCTKITDLSPLTSMHSLEFLDLSFCPSIQNWEMLPNLPSLKEICIKGATITKGTMAFLRNHKIILRGK